MSFYALPSLRCVNEAARLISRKIVKTPVFTSHSLSSIVSSKVQSNCAKTPHAPVELFFKCENFQHTGSFKFRGASHFIARLEDQELEKGVVAYSTGNHAQAVAFAAQQASWGRGFSIPAFVAVPHDCPPKKIDAARASGGIVYLSGLEPESRMETAKMIRKSTGAIIVPPADHLDIVLGQSTALSEFLEQVQEMHKVLLDAVIVPSGGGGLLVGAVAACKPRGVLVFGSEPVHGGPGLAKSLSVGRRALRLEPKRTIADGLRTLTGEANWEHIKSKQNVDGVLTASEDEIKEATRLVVETLGFIIEPSAAIPLATALFSKEFHQRIMKKKEPTRVGVVLTGGNIGVKELQAIVPGIDLE